MDISQQVDALEQRTEKLKASFEAARRETSEKARAPLDRAKADAVTPRSAASVRGRPKDRERGSSDA